VYRVLSSIEQHEASGAVCALGFSRVEAKLSNQCRLLIAKALCTRAAAINKASVAAATNSH